MKILLYFIAIYLILSLICGSILIGIMIKKGYKVPKNLLELAKVFFLSPIICCKEIISVLLKELKK